MQYTPESATTEATATTTTPKVIASATEATPTPTSAETSTPSTIRPSPSAATESSTVAAIWTSEPYSARKGQRFWLWTTSETTTKSAGLPTPNGPTTFHINKDALTRDNQAV